MDGNLYVLAVNGKSSPTAAAAVARKKKKKLLFKVNCSPNCINFIIDVVVVVFIFLMWVFICAHT